MTIAVASQKGGTGKTSTSISLAAGLARNGKKSLLIDLDSQANSSKVLIPDYLRLHEDETVHRTILGRKPLPIHGTQIDNLFIAPSHILLSNTDVELTTARDHREARLKRQLDPIKNDYDHIFIDCPPNLGWLTVNALAAADKIIVVVAPGYFELDSLVQINKTIQEARELYNPELEVLGYLFNMADRTTNSRTSLRLLRQTYGNGVFQTLIPKNVDMKNAHFNKTDIYQFREQAPAAQAFGKLIDEIFYGKTTQ